MPHGDADAVSAARLTAALREACAPVLHLCYADCTDGHAVQGAEQPKKGCAPCAQKRQLNKKKFREARGTGS